MTLTMTKRRLDLLRAVDAGHVFRMLYSHPIESRRVYLSPPPNDRADTVTSAVEHLVAAGLVELGDKPEVSGQRWQYKLTDDGEKALAEVSET